MSKYKRIFVVGHIGAGKAVFAKLLADKLGWKFIDADLGLEAHVGRTITDILGKQGEESFQQCATEILFYQLEQENIVVCTDGSILNTEKNRQLLSSEFVIYLRAATPIQLERLLHSHKVLLPTSDFKILLDTLHKERDDLYNKAACFKINTSESVSALENAINETIKVFSAET